MAYISFQPSDYFNTVLYTGTGSTQSITGVGFQPDLVWCKDRTNSYDHVWFDAVRGATKRIVSNTTGAETTASTDLTAFASDGFTVGSGSNINNSGNNFVSWNWKAGTGQGSSNTDGSINTTYTSVNTTAGFSISQYTGAGSTSTVGHGLGVAPKVIMIKGLSNSGAWQFYHEDIGNNKKLILNTDGAEISSGYMNNTSPTSSVFTVVNDSDVGTSGYTYIAYCFAEKKGFSKFGSYVGNGSGDGTYVHLGFSPAFVMVKRTDTAKPWQMYDNKRVGYNPDNNQLNANDTAVEATNDFLDIVSNGFKVRTTDSTMNTSGQTYIFMAFAEAPLVSSNGVPATAR